MEENTKSQIDAIAKDLGLTKGSFYHHFKNKDQYLKKILQFWETQTTEKAMIHMPKFTGNLRDKLKQTEIFLHESNILKIEKSIRQSISLSIVQEYLRKMDPLRISIMVKFFIDDGYSLDEAEFKSRMIYNIQIAELITFGKPSSHFLSLDELEARLDFYLL